MDDKGSNIDVLFRNGLKDYEVLPPPEIWDNIRPAVRKNLQPFSILRAAAMIAVILSLSFLAYRWSLVISTDIAGNSSVINSESGAPGLNTVPLVVPQNMPVAAERILLSYAAKPVTPMARSAEQIIESDVPAQIISQSFENKLPASDYLLKAEPGKMLDNKTGNPSTLIIEPVHYDPAIASKEVTTRWSVAALISPTYYTTFLTGSTLVTDPLLADNQSRMSYSGGVALSYKINKRFSIQSGLYYSTLGQELAGVYSYGGFENYDMVKGDNNFKILTPSGLVYTDNPDVFLYDAMPQGKIITQYTSDVFDPVKANLQYLDKTLRQNFSYLEFPFIVRYKIVDRGIDFNIIGGLSSNILVENNVYATLNSGKYSVGKTEGMNPLTFSSSLGMGVEYSLSKNFSFNLEPTLRYYLNSFSEMSGMKIHPYSFGVFSGLSYKF
jgi:hypothetical protein